MIEEKDPIALSLLAQYNNIQMPNLQLGEIEISALLKYLEEETARIEPQPPRDHKQPHDHSREPAAERQQ
jgi:protein SCO1/2